MPVDTEAGDAIALAEAIQSVADVLDEEDHERNVDACAANLAAEAELLCLDEAFVVRLVQSWRELLRREKAQQDG